MMKTYKDLEGRILPSNIFHCTNFRYPHNWQHFSDKSDAKTTVIIAVKLWSKVHIGFFPPNRIAHLLDVTTIRETSLRDFPISVKEKSEFQQ